MSLLWVNIAPKHLNSDTSLKLRFSTSTSEKKLRRFYIRITVYVIIFSRFRMLRAYVWGDNFAFVLFGFRRRRFTGALIMYYTPYAISTPIFEPLTSTTNHDRITPDSCRICFRFVQQYYGLLGKKPNIIGVKLGCLGSTRVRPA